MNEQVASEIRELNEKLDLIIQATGLGKKPEKKPRLSKKEKIQAYAQQFKSAQVRKILTRNKN